MRASFSSFSSFTFHSLFRFSFYLIENLDFLHSLISTLWAVISHPPPISKQLGQQVFPTMPGFAYYSLNPFSFFFFYTNLGTGIFIFTNQRISFSFYFLNWILIFTFTVFQLNYVINFHIFLGSDLLFTIFSLPRYKFRFLILIFSWFIFIHFALYWLM